jgi:general secretion pathway protein N
MRHRLLRKVPVRLALLALVLGAPASTLALQTDADDINLDAPHRAGVPSTPSLWDQPASPPPILVRPPAQAPQQTDKLTPSANPLWAIPLATLSNTRERPIFSQSRRPARATVASAPAAKVPPSPPRVERPELSLVGTVVGDDTSLGVFVDPATRTALRLKIGDDFQGWKLRSVQGREVTLMLDGRTAILRLPPPDAPKAAGSARGNADRATAQHRTDDARSPLRKSRR